MYINIAVTLKFKYKYTCGGGKKELNKDVDLTVTPVFEAWTT